MPAITGNLGPQANAGFSPISIAGCQLWFDAADPSTLTLNGSTVASWRDKSANGYSVGQATTANQPTYATNLLNGLAGIQLSSSTYLYQVGSSIPNFSSSASTTVIMVAKNGSTIPASGWNILNTMWFNGGAQGPTYRYHLSFAIGTTNGIALYAAGTQVGQITAVPLGANAILGFTISPSGNSINANGTLTTYTGTTAPNASNGTWFLFGDARGQQYQSDVNVYEFLGFNTTLSTTDRQNVEGYLAQKWGLTANLPPGHPGITTNYVASQPRIFRIGPLPGTRTPFLVTANQPPAPLILTTTTFAATGANQTFTVPATTSSVNVFMWGAAGGGGYVGGGNAAKAGAGAYVQGTLAVTPGATIRIVVGKGGIAGSQVTTYGGGGAGIPGNTCGSGGGRSAIQFTAGTDIVTVAGGGGGGYYNANGTGGWGDATTGTGRAGSAAAGGNAVYGGKGGTQSAGGAAGQENYGGNPTAGSLYQGGNGSTWSGAGGGGGYYGGGGGGAGEPIGGGGGGGSSLTTALTSFVGYNSSDGFSTPFAGTYNPSSIYGTAGGPGSTGGDGRVVLVYYQ